jgi:hypothetical protein
VEHLDRPDGARDEREGRRAVADDVGLGQVLEQGLRLPGLLGEVVGREVGQRDVPPRVHGDLVPARCDLTDQLR